MAKGKRKGRKKPVQPEPEAGDDDGVRGFDGACTGAVHRTAHLPSISRIQPSLPALGIIVEIGGMWWAAFVNVRVTLDVSLYVAARGSMPLCRHIRVSLSSGDMRKSGVGSGSVVGD